MEKVEVSKAELKARLKENLETHQKDFEIAWEAFREKAVHNFEERLKQVKNLKKGEQINLFVNLTVPEDHTNDYEQALDMLDWEVDETVMLTQYEFTQLVRDDWGWKGAFAQTNAFYTGSMSPSKS